MNCERCGIKISLTLANEQDPTEKLCRGCYLDKKSGGAPQMTECIFCSLELEEGNLCERCLAGRTDLEIATRRLIAAAVMWREEFNAGAVTEKTQDKLDQMQEQYKQAFERGVM